MTEQKRNNAERLGDALLKFVERAANEPTCEKEIEVLPHVAHELIELIAQGNY